jgi:2-phosphoglycerate kinase
MNEVSKNRHPWDVLLLGGPSGVGKTSVSYALARYFDVGITEVDDLHIAAERLTTPEQQPILHYWSTHPQAIHLSAENILELHISVCRVLSPVIRAVVANHIETRTPIVLEGDYLLPELMVQDEAEEPTTRLRSVFLYEPDETQIIRNFAVREPNVAEQTKRARVSWLFGQWLADECQRLGLAALPTRPWDTLLERIDETMG